LRRIVLADDHPVVLSGVRGLVEASGQFEIVAQCSDGLQAFAKIRELRPDIALLDISMPNLDGIGVVEKLSAEGDTTPVVLLTATASDDQISRAVGRGARGLLLKDTAPDLLIQCLETVSAGGVWLPGSVVDEALQRSAVRQHEARRLDEALTTREREITFLVAEGLANKEISRKLNISEGTVKIHLHNIFQKLEVNNRTALTALALAYRRRD
jgi:DNA-binding NarL/FixJ family response regulator